MSPTSPLTPHPSKSSSPSSASSLSNPAIPLSPAAVYGRAFENALLGVEKPARYTGGEFNTVVKPDSEVAVRVALAFPDLYDIGMSYHGFKILYERLNAMEGVQAERVFAPWRDFAALLRERGVPLYTLETFKPLSACDIVGFTLQHEMNYTNIPEMLELGGVPVEAAKRGSTDPIVIAGGHGASNPEPLACVFDAFVVGDGEAALEEIVRRVEAARIPDAENDAPRWRMDRDELLASLMDIDGVYIPSFYEPEWNADGTIKAMRPLREDAPPVVRRAYFDISADSGSVRPVVPVTRIVHDRFALETRRGCVAGCRFCQAGMITRPVRERGVDRLVAAALEGIRNTGHEEVSLLSLSSADYSRIGELTRRLRDALSPDHVSVSLPSLRVNAFDVQLADDIGHVRKSGFTFAPEAGTDRLRRAINKDVDDARLFEAIEAVLRRGWRTLKLYFMVGLPTETDADIEGIADIAARTVRMGRDIAGRAFQLNLSLSPFVPKPQTPFEREPQPPAAELERRLGLIESRLDRRHVSIKRHGIRQSFLEAALARGDRRMGRVILRAHALGCLFDGWRDEFRPDLWEQAFADEGLDPAFYANRRRGDDETLPWSHISAGPSAEFLAHERQRTADAEVTPDCLSSPCHECGACAPGMGNVLAADAPSDPSEATKAEPNALAPDAPALPAQKAARRRKGEEPGEYIAPLCRLRFRFTKLGSLRFSLAPGPRQMRPPHLPAGGPAPRAHAGFFSPAAHRTRPAAADGVCVGGRTSGRVVHGGNRPG